MADMCMICDGASHDEVLFYVHGLIENHGWAITPIGDDPPGRSWVYTIGLAAAFDHPELVLVDIEIATATAVLDELGERIRAGERLVDVDAVVLDDGRHVRLVDVDQTHIDAGLLNLWFDYYG